MAPKDLTGKRFGSLTVMSRDPNRKSYWLCQCDCGQETSVFHSNLQREHTRSCGCLGSRQTIGNRVRKHGMTRAPEYKPWKSILQRCLNPRDAAFKDYGGRGITVCESWQHSFESFYADMGPRPTPEHSIDRIDNNLGYGPSNCRWSTQTEQCNNKRNNRIVEYLGEQMTLTEASIRAGLRPGTVIMRVHTGWTVERALTTPIRKHRDYPCSSA